MPVPPSISAAARGVPARNPISGTSEGEPEAGIFTPGCFPSLNASIVPAVAPAARAPTAPSCRASPRSAPYPSACAVFSAPPDAAADITLDTSSE